MSLGLLRLEKRLSPSTLIAIVLLLAMVVLVGLPVPWPSSPSVSGRTYSPSIRALQGIPKNGFELVYQSSAGATSDSLLKKLSPIKIIARMAQFPTLMVSFDTEWRPRYLSELERREFVYLRGKARTRGKGDVLPIAGTFRVDSKTGRIFPDSFSLTIESRSGRRTVHLELFYSQDDSQRARANRAIAHTHDAGCTDEHHTAGHHHDYFDPVQNSTRRGALSKSLAYLIPITLIADKYYSRTNGDRTESLMIRTMNAVNVLYQPVDVVFDIRSIVVLNERSDPFSESRFTRDLLFDIADNSPLGNLFGWTPLMHIFTDRGLLNAESGTRRAGVAFQRSLCSDTDNFGITAYDRNATVHAAIAAHEMAHNLDGRHEFASYDSQRGGSLMSAVYSPNNNINRFSALNQVAMTSHIEASDCVELVEVYRPGSGGSTEPGDVDRVLVQEEVVAQLEQQFSSLKSLRRSKGRGQSEREIKALLSEVLEFVRIGESGSRLRITSTSNDPSDKLEKQVLRALGMKPFRKNQNVFSRKFRRALKRVQRSLAKILRDLS